MTRLLGRLLSSFDGGEAEGEREPEHAEVAEDRPRGRLRPRCARRTPTIDVGGEDEKSVVTGHARAKPFSDGC